MKVFIMTDLEGVAGVLNGRDYLAPGARWYDLARRLLTQEVNAAVAGLAAGGFREFLVADGHGAGAVDIEELDPRARLGRGWGAEPYPFGLTREFDAMAYVGQHAKAGTPLSHLTHTGWWNVRDQRINDISVGEYGEGALCAGELGVPVIFAAGEKALTLEVNALTPWVETAVVLEGILATTGDDLTGEQAELFHEAAIHLQPQAACALIQEAAGKAASRFARDRAAFKPLKLDPPYQLERFFRAYKGLAPYTVKREHAHSIIAMLNSLCS